MRFSSKVRRGVDSLRDDICKGCRGRNLIDVSHTLYQDLGVEGIVEIVWVDERGGQRVGGIDMLLRGQGWFGGALVETYHTPTSKRMLVHSGDCNVTGIVGRWGLGQATHGDHNQSIGGILVRKRKDSRLYNLTHSTIGTEALHIHSFWISYCFEWNAVGLAEPSHLSRLYCIEGS